MMVRCLEKYLLREHKREYDMRIIYITALIASLWASTGCAHNDGRNGLAGSQAPGSDMAIKSAAYRQMLDADPTDTRTRLEYATTLSWQGKYRAAEEQYTTLLKQQPDNIEAMKALGYNYVWSDRFDLAERQFKQALDTAPEDFGIQKGLALTYLRSGRCSQALEAFKSLRQQHPDDLEILAAIESVEAGVTDGVEKHGHD